MFRKLIGRTTLLIVVVVLANCNNREVESPSTETPQNDPGSIAFGTISPTDELNTLVVLELQSGLKQDLKNGQRIFFTVENRSSEMVVFPVDFNVELFTYQEAKGVWMDVGNRVTYVQQMGDTIALLPKASVDNETDATWIGSLLVRPFVSNTTQPTIVRVVIAGEIYRDGKPIGEKVGAYTDVTLQP